MASYKTDKKALGIETFYFYDGFVLLCRENIIESFCVASLRVTVYWFIKQFEETGNECDKHVKGCKHSTSV
jgi:hypothetical protein